MEYTLTRKRVREFPTEETLTDALTILLDSVAYNDEQFMKTNLGALKAWLSLTLELPDFLSLTALSADPQDPLEGKSVIWQSDGTQTGDKGDVLIKITANGETKMATLIKFNLLT